MSTTLPLTRARDVFWNGIVRPWLDLRTRKAAIGGGRLAGRVQPGWAGTAQERMRGLTRRAPGAQNIARAQDPRGKRARNLLDRSGRRRQSLKANRPLATRLKRSEL